jgi:TldD protein
MSNSSRPFGPTRRTFLAQTTAAVVGALVGAAPRGATALSLTRRGGTCTAATLLPAAQPSDLQLLATRAIDAARSAGASYADIRVAELQTLYILPDMNLGASLSAEYTHGIRVLVDGTWAFVHGSLPSVDAVTSAARSAVAMARGYAKLTRRRVELVPAPVATGEWATPCKIDPFLVPLKYQAAALSAPVNAAMRVSHAGADRMGVRWRKTLQVFASSEGTLTTQLLRDADRIGAWASAGLGMGTVRLPIGTTFVSGGYEAVMRPAAEDEFKQRAEEARFLAAIPRGHLDVGRYPVVFDGRTMGLLVGSTIGPALELDRVLGEEVGASGTSFLAPFEGQLGALVVSPQLTVTGQAATRSAAKWDGEGVQPEDHPVIIDGKLVDYHTTRATAPALRTWYEQHGKPLRSHGCAPVSNAGDPVLVRAPHLRVSPASAASSLEDLYRDMQHGLVVLGRSQLSSDEGLASMSLVSERGNADGLLLEIRRGKIVRRLYGNGMQFRTAPFWQRQLVALGDARTLQENVSFLYKGMPWKGAWQSATAPAAIFKDIPVFSTVVSG